MRSCPLCLPFQPCRSTTPHVQAGYPVRRSDTPCSAAPLGVSSLARNIHSNMPSRTAVGTSSMFLETYRSGGARDRGTALALRLGLLGRWLGNLLRLAKPFGQAKEFRNVVRGRNAHFDQECALHTVPLAVFSGSEWCPMGHVGDGIGFHDRFAICIPPDLMRIPVDGALRHWCRRQLMHVEPLLDDFVSIGGIDRAIRAAVPN